MKPVAAGLNKQGHIELHKKTSSLCERCDGRLVLSHIKIKLMIFFCSNNSHAEKFEDVINMRQNIWKKLALQTIERVLRKTI